jgi:phosphoribosylformimino-5-aminoimidazole carboxamide ribonucleotide (ProFAR) isomerase
LLVHLENGGDLERINKKSVGPKIKDLIMADLVITVDTGKRYATTSKWQEHYRISIVNMLKKFQPGLSQGIYEALAWEGLISTVRGMH